jgi:hypothetical protein
LDLGFIIADGFVALLFVVTLISDLTGWGNRIRGLRWSASQGPGQRLIGAGISLECGTFCLTGLARYRHWPHQRHDHMLGYAIPAMLVATILIIAGLAVHLRSRRATR